MRNKEPHPTRTVLHIIEQPEGQGEDPRANHVYDLPPLLLLPRGLEIQLAADHVDEESDASIQRQLCGNLHIREEPSAYGAVEIGVVENIEETGHHEANVTVRDEDKDELWVMSVQERYEMKEIKHRTIENVGNDELSIRPVCKHIVHRKDQPREKGHECARDENDPVVSLPSHLRQIWK